MLYKAERFLHYEGPGASKVPGRLKTCSVEGEL